MKTFELKVNITATSREEINDVLYLIGKQIEDGYVEGHDRNETGQYYYNVTEQSEED